MLNLFWNIYVNADPVFSFKDKQYGNTVPYFWLEWVCTLLEFFDSQENRKKENFWLALMPPQQDSPNTLFGWSS